MTRTMSQERSEMRNDILVLSVKYCTQVSVKLFRVSAVELCYLICHTVILSCSIFMSYTSKKIEMDQHKVLYLNL